MRFAGVVVVVSVSCVCTAGAARAENLPVVLAPGFMGQRASGVMPPYFPVIERALVAAGADVAELQPPPVAGSDARGADLMRQIDAVRARTGAARVIVIAHSQGGVDVRAAIAQGYGAHLAAVVTIASPHHGTGVADTALTWPMPLVRAALVAAAIGEQLAEGDDATTADVDAALFNMSTPGMLRFDTAHPSVDANVPFFSVAGITAVRDRDGDCAGGRWSAPRVVDERHPALVFGAAMIEAALGPVENDGVVPTRSQRFGTFLGCVPADHLDWEGFDDRGPFDPAAFTVELWHGLVDVALHGADAMDAHVPRLAALSFAATTPSPSRRSVEVGRR